MGATHFSGPIYSQGIPLFGSLPLMPMNGGRAYFVDPENGADGNTGDADSPLLSITNSSGTGAYDRCVSGRGDVVFLRGGPTSSGTTGQTVRLSSTLTWAKYNTHLVGLGAPTRVGQRSRITGPSTGGTFSPVMTVSGHGCIFSNFAVFDDYTVDPVAVKVTGQRNYFGNVNMQGMGAATGADDAAGASLWIAAGAENTFERCTIGLDTVPRSTTNGEILLTSAATRNVFHDCDIVSYSDNAGHLFVKAANSGDLDRYTLFNDCRFHNAPTGIASGTTMTQAMNVHASAGGYIWVTGMSSLIGATDWAAADNGNVFVDRVVAAAGTAGLAVAATR